MNINPILLKLKEATGLPVAPDLYMGDAKRYLVFNYANEMPSLSGDDSPVADTALIQVHLYLPCGENYMEWKETIRDFLEQNGFDDIEIQSTVEPDMKYTHVIFECEYTKGRE